MAEKDFGNIWKEVQALGLSGQAHLDALKTALEEAKDKTTADWSWTIDEYDRFISIMEDMGITQRSRGKLYLAFAVMLHRKFQGNNCTAEAICEMIAKKYDITKELVVTEIAYLQNNIYSNLTGVRAMVDANAVATVEKYFGGNEAKIKILDEFIVAIANAMK